MDIKNSVFIEKAETQWAAYRDLLVSLGAEIELIAPQEGLPDMVFTANAGFIFGNTFIKSNMRHKERQPEDIYFEKWFKDNGFHLLELPEGLFYEGEGDTVAMGDKVFFGSPFRTDVRSHDLVARILNKKPISLNLTDERFYHLDMAFCPLGEEDIAYYPGAFDDESIKLIEENISHKILIDEKNALNFAGNSIAIGESVIINKGCTEFASDLKAKGYKVYELEFSEFIKSGGGAKCLALHI